MNEDTQKRIGTILDETARRDAIHICVAPVVAGEDLKPGQRVGLCSDRKTATPHAHKIVGIVDPFLNAPVKEGQRCFVFLFPGTVTGMRHVWTAPGFDSTRREGT